MKEVALVFSPPPIVASFEKRPMGFTVAKEQFWALPRLGEGLYAWVYIHIDTLSYVHMRMCSVCVCVHTYMYIYIHIYTHMCRCVCVHG